MTLAALVVLMAGLAAGKAGPVGLATSSESPSSGQPPRAAEARHEMRATPEDVRPAVTCTLRIVHAPSNFDALILSRPPGQAVDGGIVRDSVSPCTK
jgi:hypothetical protein